jgi:hypothetical protein
MSARRAVIDMIGLLFIVFVIDHRKTGDAMKPRHTVA